jgi:hypothetical protein
MSIRLEREGVSLTVRLDLEGVGPADVDALVAGTEMVVGGITIDSRGGTVNFEATTEGGELWIEVPTNVLRPALDDLRRRLAGAPAEGMDVSD